MKNHFNRKSLLHQFTHHAGLSLAEASMLAYMSPEAVEAEIGDWGMSAPIPPFDVSHTQGFVAKDDELLILAFRGTDQNFGDWLRNLRVLRINHEMGRVHRGFNTGLNHVWEDIVKPVLHEWGVGRQVWFTGHSLGAALASLAAARVQVQIPEVDVTGIVTFGQPRLAKADFREEFNGVFQNRFHRYVNHKDIVPRIPPAYRHVGKLIYFGEDGDITEANSRSLELSISGSAPDQLSELEFEELREALDDIHLKGSACDSTLSNATLMLEGKLPDLGVVKAIRDHSIRDGYIPALLKNL